MPDEPFNTHAQLKQATDLIQQTADRLHEQMVAMAAQLLPFPYFMGSMQVQAIEAEPGGVQKADRGCVVVCADGELYEFTMRMQPSAFGFDSGLERDDSVKPLTLPPEEYIVYAYNALKEMAGLLEDRKARAKKYSY